MIGMVATVRVLPGKVAEFEAIGREVAAKTKANEPGALFYQLTRSRTQADTYLSVEFYRDQAALDHHAATDYLAAAMVAMQSCVDGTPQVEFVDSLDE